MRFPWDDSFMWGDPAAWGRAVQRIWSALIDCRAALLRWCSGATLAMRLYKPELPRGWAPLGIHLARNAGQMNGA